MRRSGAAAQYTEGRQRLDVRVRRRPAKEDGATSVIAEPDLAAVNDVPEPESRRSGRHLRRGRVSRWTGAVQLGILVAFTAPAVVLWWHAWSGGPGSTIRCECLDPGQQVWFVAWPA